jgi:hypothetical protein
MGLLSGIVDEVFGLCQCIHCREKISYSDQDKLPPEPCQYCARYQDLYTYYDCVCEWCTDIKRGPNKIFHEELDKVYPLVGMGMEGARRQHMVNGFNSPHDMVETFLSNFKNPLDLLTVWDVSGYYYSFKNNYNNINKNIYYINKSLFDLGFEESDDSFEEKFESERTFIQKMGLSESKIVFDYLSKVKGVQI